MNTTIDPRSPAHASPVCPHLGTLGEDPSPGPFIEYPSFENRCWSGERPTPLLLTDQATLCLCAGHRHCPRFVAARAARPSAPRPGSVPLQPSAPPPAADDPISHALDALEGEIKAATVAQRRSRQRWGWIGAGLIFMSSLLCGGVFAGYVGWQMVNADLFTARPGRVDTLAETEAPAPAQPQIYLIVTATSSPADAPAVPVQPAEQALAQAPADPAQALSFPQAVTPTPLRFMPEPALQSAEAAQAAQNAPGVEALLPESAAPAEASVPLPDMQLEIPTRRPTPVFDIPTSTPEPELLPPTATPTPVPPSGTPVVIFSARDAELDPGKCTILSWFVENVRAVYYEEQGVDGHGEREECVDNDKNDYHLAVVLPNGATQTYTVTVDVLLPTETPKPTATFTEVPLPSPTWTPSEPTATPTPQTSYGVLLQLDGDSTITCAAGETCETNFFLTNTGSAVDTLSVYFTEAGAWPRQLCRLDGVCSADRLDLVNMGPANTGVARLRVTIPKEAEPGSMTYRVQASSHGSGGKSLSDTVTVRVRVQ